jgi:hemolysin III
MEHSVKPHRISIPKYTLGEELMNSITHGVGALLGIAALVLCIVKSCMPFDGYKLASSIVFGLTTTLLYLMSCLYHALKVNRAKRVFRVMDHCTIFMLIAGTYTPIVLSAMRPIDPVASWIMFGVVWGLAAAAMTFTAIDLKKYSVFSMICYIGMGWCIVVKVPLLIQAVGWGGFWLILLGGVCYTIGAVLYGMGRKKRYMHSIFHLFVVAGSILHLLAVLLFAI